MKRLSSIELVYIFELIVYNLSCHKSSIQRLQMLFGDLATLNLLFMIKHFKSQVINSKVYFAEKYMVLKNPVKFIYRK